MDLRSSMLKYESLYSAYASFDKDAKRLQPFTPDYRSNYFRDIDRIIHSTSYTRYIGKTQVFSMPNNDNISRRMVHVQLVSKIARTIGRALSLNEDLIEAIALGHDLGHVPFGHDGEKILNEICIKNNLGYFNHNVQSVRTLMFLEKNGKGLNLCVQVLDGILCHNGELELQEYKPKEKNEKEFLNDYNKCYQEKNYNSTLVPMTLEGCIVRISDIIGYLGRDIEDAEKLGIITKDIIPESISNVLGNTNKDIINNIINDLVTNSINKPFIKISDEVFNAIKDLKTFNYKYIYDVSHTNEERENVKLMFNTLFTKLLDILNSNDYNQNIYKNYLNKMTDEYKNNNSNERIVIDYIAGMTDEYFINEYKKLSRLSW